MIRPAVVDHLRRFLRPAVETGLISQTELNEAMRAVRGLCGEKPAANPRRLTRTQEVADRCRVSPRTVRRWAKRGVLTPIYLEAGNARSLRFSSQEVENLMAGQGQNGGRHER